MKKYPIPRLMRAKGKEKIICLTAYDAFLATILNQSSADIILVGDTLGHVVQGQDSTIPVTVDEMIYHCRIVRRNAPEKLVIADMPFGSYGITTEDTVRQCAHVFKNTEVGAVKMEGASESILEAIPRLNEMGVPVMGHIGLRPQSVNIYGGYKTDGKTQKDRDRLLHEAQLLAKAGVFAIVLESVIGEVAKEITQKVPALTIGIGSGKDVDGQIIVIHDLLGMTTGRVPSFVREYANIKEVSQNAVEQWAEDVKKGHYPSLSETYQRPSSQDMKN